MRTIERKPVQIGASVSALVLAAIAISFAATARAELIVTDTANAMPGYYGTLNIHFFEETSPPMEVNGSVDYAVYAPGYFNLSFPGKDPSNGSRYVYRYQLHNNASTDGIFELTVALVGLTNKTDAKNCTSVDPTAGGYPSGGVAPPAYYYSIAGNPPTSVYWSYPNLLQSGADSTMLIFTSSLAPTFQLATVNATTTIQHWVDDDGTQYNWWEGQLPSPVPEPAVWVGLLSFCGFLLTYRAVFRRR